ncbi:MAG: HD domain-containing protein [Candidatus Heimdallarchaeota archaeon]|nr:MAG: HD domain-containing protein [Candidatus Heimdallarchaeota archaeon]
MDDYVQEVFSNQLAQISDNTLRQKVIDVCVEALKMGNDGNGWKNMDFPFTLVIPGVKVPFVDHVRIVTDLALQSASILEKQGIPVNHDILVASAILHDIGKPLEFALTSSGEVVKSNVGNKLRHPITGAGLAMKHELPFDVVQNIYQHSWEGDKGPGRTIEGEIVHRCDFLHFGPLKISLESK